MDQEAHDLESLEHMLQLKQWWKMRNEVMAALISHVNYVGLSPARKSEPLKDFWQRGFMVNLIYWQL